MEDRKVEMFKVLASKPRIKIIVLLKQHGALEVNELAEALGISQSAVSQHLKLLRHAGLVNNERKGFYISYTVDHEALANCYELLSEICLYNCWETGGGQKEKLAKPPCKLFLLKRYERKLQKRLDEITIKIQDLDVKR